MLKDTQYLKRLKIFQLFYIDDICHVFSTLMAVTLA
jgi:hypothetical protein